MFPNPRSRICAGGLFVFLACIAAPALADWPTDPAVNVRVSNTYPGYDTGEYLSLVPDGAGGFVWAAVTHHQSGGFVAGRVDAFGVPLWWRGVGGDFTIFETTDERKLPGFAADGAGGVFEVWNSANGSLCAQHWGANGIWSGSGEHGSVVLSSTDGWYPRIVGDGLGGALVTWYSRTAPTGIRVQRIGADGTVRWPAGGVRAFYAAEWIDLLPDGSGGAFVVCTVGWPFAQHLDSTGVALWPDAGPNWGSEYGPWGVNLRPAADPLGNDYANDPYWVHDEQSMCLWPYRSLRVVPDGAGGLVAVWLERGTPVGYPFHGEIYAQRVSAAGVPLWGAGGAAVCARPDQQLWPVTAPDGTGGVIVAWQDLRAVSHWDIYAQRVDGSGVPRWAAGGIPICTAAGSQVRPVIAAVPAGGAIVTWDDPRYDVYAQRVDGDGVARWTPDGTPVSTATGSQVRPQLVSDGADGALVAWEDWRLGAFDGMQVYAQRVPLNPPVAVLVSLVSADAMPGAVRVSWRAAGASTFTLERSNGSGWLQRGALTADEAGMVTLEDRDVTAGQRYGYRLVSGAATFGEVFVDVPVAARLALHGAHPNPTTGPVALRFSLGEGGPATLALVDLAGRRVLERDLGALGPGEHVLEVGRGTVLAQGLYLASIRQAERTVTGKIVVTR